MSEQTIKDAIEDLQSGIDHAKWIDSVYVEMPVTADTLSLAVTALRTQLAPVSEDVDRAIDWIQTGKYDTPIGDHEYQADSRFHPDTIRFRQTILAALRAQIEPGERARSTSTDSTRATDEEVQEAIDRRRIITIISELEEFANQRLDGNYIPPDLSKGEVLDVVVPILRAALRAQIDPGEPCEWIEVTNGRGGHKCSACNNYAPSYQNGVEYLSPFCPNCGRQIELARSDSTDSTRATDEEVQEAIDSRRIITIISELEEFANQRLDGNYIPPDLSKGEVLDVVIPILKSALRAQLAPVSEDVQKIIKDYEGTIQRRKENIDLYLKSHNPELIIATSALGRALHRDEIILTALRRLEDKELDLCRRKLERIEAECKVWVSNDLGYEIRKILKSS